MNAKQWYQRRVHGVGKKLLFNCTNGNHGNTHLDVTKSQVLDRFTLHPLS
eukprot:TRINITY_DN4810_c0_g1_i1.p2 TRINITY_DN4810_c0_g1~~TRINITY_DN4810_c0_g1_i1.p2  ORF type:complete len:50 (+),score=14.23 TRINITY_DN4810_c0_g1_i1:19-168(+)